MQVSVHTDLGAIAVDRNGSFGTPTPRRLSVSLAATRSTYLTILSWSFTFFSFARLVVYLPTLWAIYSSGDASQHSLWTWLTWFASNLTMAAWLYEEAGQRMSRAALVNLCNATMCGAVAALVFACRW